MGINNILSFKEAFAQYFLKDINRFLIFQVLSWWCFRGLIFRLQVCKLFSRHFPLCHFKMDTCNKELLLQTLTLFFPPVALSLKAWIGESLWVCFFSKTWMKPSLSSWTLLISESILLHGLSRKLFSKMLFCHTHGAERWRDLEKMYFLQLCFAKVC